MPIPCSYAALAEEVLADPRGSPEIAPHNFMFSHLRSQKGRSWKYSAGRVGAVLAFLLHGAAAQTIDLGTASDFAVLGGSGITVAGAVRSTQMVGNLGTFPTTSITGLGNVILVGVNHAGDAVTQQAKNDLLIAYNAAAARVATVVFAPGSNLGGRSLVPGVYRDSTAFGLTGTLTLNAGGNPNAVWIFQAGSSLTTASSSRVVLLGGAQACHIFWQVGSSAALGSSSVFKGTILALTSITLTTGAAVEGRLLALNGAVTLDTNTLAVPICAGTGSVAGGDQTSPAVIAAALGNVLGLLPLTPNQMEAAGALHRAPENPRQGRVLDYLASSEIGALPHLLDRIAPEELTSIYRLGFAQFDTEVFTVQQRLTELRAPSPEENRGTPAPASDGKRIVPDKEDLKEDAPSEGSAAGRWGFFITETGEFASLGDTANAHGFNSKSAGTTLGVDRRLSEHFTLGLTLGYARTETDLIDDGKIKADGGKAALYASYHTGGFYTEGLIGGGYTSYDTRRGALDGTAYGHADGAQFDASGGLGYDWRLGRVTITPFASVLYTLVGIDGFDERGSLEPLHIQSQHESSLRSRVGLRAARAGRIGGVTITPSLGAEWQHEYLETELPLESRFADGTGSLFTVHGPGIGRDSALLTGALHVAWKRYATYLAYQADLGRANYESQTVLAGFRVSW